MAAQLNVSEQSDADQTSLSDQSLLNRSVRSLRIAEKKRKKKEVDPFGLALKYFSDGRFRLKLIADRHQMVALLLPTAGGRGFLR